MLPFFVTAEAQAANLNVTAGLPPNQYVSVNSSNVFANGSEPTVIMNLPSLSNWLDYGPLVCA